MLDRHESRLNGISWAPLLALAGGVFGILGAFYNEILHGSVLVAFVGAPIIEEVLKPPVSTFLLANGAQPSEPVLYRISGGARRNCFCLIENLVYLNIYISDRIHK